MLTLPIKKKWFDMILAGEKTDEYREPTLYWERRLSNECRKQRVPKHGFGLRLKIRNGYGKDAPSAIITLHNIDTGFGAECWGAIPGKTYIRLHIMNVEVAGDVSDRSKCHLRHANGNCLPMGGFCTAVIDEICKGLQTAYEHGRHDGQTDALLKQTGYPDCEHAEFDGTGCLGYSGCMEDDEPIDACKNCSAYTGNRCEAVKWE